MSLEFHQAEPAHAEDLLTTWEEARKLKCSQGDYGWGTEPFTADDVSRAIELGTTNIVLLDREHAGAFERILCDPGIWGERMGNDGLAAYIHRFARRHAAAGQRFGPRVVEWVSQQTFEEGRPYVRLDCNAGNPKLCGYYEDLGFIRMGTQQIGAYAAALYQRTV